MEFRVFQHLEVWKRRRIYERAEREWPGGWEPGSVNVLQEGGSG